MSQPLCSILPYDWANGLTFFGYGEYGFITVGVGAIQVNGCELQGKSYVESGE